MQWGRPPRPTHFIAGQRARQSRLVLAGSQTHRGLPAMAAPHEELAHSKLCDQRISSRGQEVIDLLQLAERMQDLHDVSDRDPVVAPLDAIDRADADISQPSEMLLCHPRALRAILQRSPKPASVRMVKAPGRE